MEVIRLAATMDK